MQYIGFIIDGMVPSLQSCFTSRTPLALLRGYSSGTAVAQMRFRWIADYVNESQKRVRYELYRPWRKYSAVVFLKSMDRESLTLMQKLRDSGVRVIFDCNVDYLTPAHGIFYYQGMAPSEKQRMAAVKTTELCDAIIADSTHIGIAARKYKDHVTVIPDNVKDSFIARRAARVPRGDEKLILLWCGQSIKLFELLVIKDVLNKYRNNIRLRLVTNSLEAVNKWYPQYQSEFRQMLDTLHYEHIPFTNVSRLLSVYDQGGVFISPRFLNNSYNLGHTEWKITLPMARGCPVLCSPQMSYCEVAKHTANHGIRICGDDEHWDAALGKLLENNYPWQLEQQAAIEGVRHHYATSIVGERHLQCVRGVIGQGEAQC